MKFVCDSCSTKYSIADERVRGRVLKIRCKSCNHVITVRDEAHRQAESVNESIGSSFGPTQFKEGSDSTVLSAVPPGDAIGNEWYVSFDGEQEGPYSIDRACERVREQQPKGKEAHAWRPGFFIWLPVDDVP